MWRLALSALASAASAPSDHATVQGVAFGPRLVLTCRWFTNFENSRFVQCRTERGNLLRSDDGASLQCVARMCDRLDEAARRAVHGKRNEAPEGTFTVRFVGRISLYRHEKRFLGDGTETVLVEKLLSVRRSR